VARRVTTLLFSSSTLDLSALTFSRDLTLSATASCFTLRASYLNSRRTVVFLRESISFNLVWTLSILYPRAKSAFKESCLIEFLASSSTVAFLLMKSMLVVCVLCYSSIW
jgi:hypothetical protein